MSTAPSRPPSYRNLPPLERGGVRARGGFYYQDHVAAGYLLLMLTQATLLEVWCEALDDITLVWGDGTTHVFEFVQVKKLTLNQFWSIALLVKPDGKIARNDDEDEDGKVGSRPALSLLEKSLANDRGDEPCRFRLVTSVEPGKELELLKAPHAHASRTAQPFTKLRDALIAKLPDARSLNDNDVAFWADHAHWEVFDSHTTLEYRNLHHLRTFGDLHGRHLQEDQWLEVYKKVVQRAQDAAMQLDQYDPEVGHIRREEFAEWLLIVIDRAAHPHRHNVEALEEKLRAASLADRIDHAVSQRYEYRRRRFQSGYFTTVHREEVEAAARYHLNKLVVQLDAGEITSGRPFYLRCLAELEALAQDFPGQKFVWTPFLEGYMYEVAQRCVHRFGRPLT